jgi:hypothetical protein
VTIQACVRIMWLPKGVSRSCDILSPMKVSARIKRIDLEIK